VTGRSGGDVSPMSGYAPTVEAERERLRPPRLPAGHALARGRFRDAIASLLRTVELLRVITESDLRVRYGRGPWRFVRWLFEPVALVGVYLILVTFILDRPGRAPGLSLACAVVPFQLVMLTIGNAMTSLDSRRPILLNMAFKRMLIPPSAALSETLGFASSLLLIGAMMAIYAVAPTWNILWFPLVFLVNVLLAAAAAYPAILCSIWLRELRQFVLSFVRILFFLSPALVPLEETSPSIRGLLRLNPMTGLFESYRDVFMNGQAPAPWELLIPFGTAVLLLIVFVPVYRVEQRQFAKVI
jgi:lipopolysaccharide transport system permease protein